LVAPQDKDAGRSSTTMPVEGFRPMSDQHPPSPLGAGAFSLRYDLRPGDLGAVVCLHGTVYAREYGFDTTFEAYVAGPLAEFVLTRSDRDRLWIAERGGRLAGCVGVAGTSPQEAQLRWFLVEPSARGAGLGRRLLEEAVAFCGGCGYDAVFLWTVSALEAAGRLYRAFGFPWGCGDVT
jgi:GNAT superfamily N-acetyltransferase